MSTILRQVAMEELLSEAPIIDKYPELSGIQRLPGEPVFVIRARDALACTAIAQYASLALDKGLMSVFWSAMGWRNKVQAWQYDHESEVRLPD